MLEKLAEELHEARVKSGITLQEMAGKTRVDIKFLEAIDNGDFTFLSEPYVKAFIKEFAKMVGLDENRILLKYESAKKGVFPEETETDTDEKKEKQKPVQKYDATSQDNTTNQFDKLSRNVRLNLAIAVVSIFALFLIYLIFFKSSNDIIVPEKEVRW